MIKQLQLLFLLCLIAFWCNAQTKTNLVGDSVHIHGNTGAGELILQNGTKDTIGFLFNKGAGRTEFRKALLKINDSLYAIGNDTLKISQPGGNNYIFNRNISAPYAWGPNPNAQQANINISGTATIGGLYVYAPVGGEAVLHLRSNENGNVWYTAGSTIKSVNTQLDNCGLVFTTRYGQERNNIVIAYNDIHLNSEGYGSVIIRSAGNAAALNSPSLYLSGLNDATSVPQMVISVNGVLSKQPLPFADFVPGSTSDSRGAIGQLAADDNYLYRKTSTGWTRTPITWSTF